MGTRNGDGDGDGDEGQNPKRGWRAGGMSPPPRRPIAIPTLSSILLSSFFHVLGHEW